MSLTLIPFSDIFVSGFILLKKNKNRKLSERKPCYVNIHSISLQRKKL